MFFIKTLLVCDVTQKREALWVKMVFLLPELLKGHHGSEYFLRILYPFCLSPDIIPLI